MTHKTNLLFSNPLQTAVAAIYLNANASDQTASSGFTKTELDRESAALCRRAADEIDSRTP